MHKFGLFSDPHIGLDRRAHTTTKSRAALKMALYSAADQVACSITAGQTLCLGDLFDKSHNDEVTIMQGYKVASQCDLVLGGNHDVPNREGTVSSLEVVNEALRSKGNILTPCVGQSLYFNNKFNKNNAGRVFSVPHQSSQSLFDETIGILLDEPAEEDTLEIVILHCNYECGFADNEISLNLTSEAADQLLERFDYVFIGHEHESRVLKDGRLIIVGNTHPTSFSDISDKFVWYIDEHDEIQKELIWEEETGFKLLSFNSLPEEVNDFKTEAQFIEVQGTLSVEEYAGVADFMVKVWEANPQAYMIRNNLKPIEQDDIEEIGLTEIDDLPAHITEELKDDEDMKKLWESYLGKL